MNKIFFKKIGVQQAEYNKKWELSDTRRIIFYVEFSNGFIWYPKDAEIKLIQEARSNCFNHNIQFPNIDKDKKENEQ